MIRCKKFLYALAALLLLGALILLSFVELRPGISPSQEAAEEGPVLGYVQLPGGSAWWEEFDAELREKTASLGMQLLSVASDWTQEGEISAIRTLLSYRVDVIVFCPVITGGWESVISEAEAAQVPLLTFGSTVTVPAGRQAVSAVTEDLNTQGAEAVRFLEEQFGKRDTPLRLVEFRSLSSSSASITLSGAIRRALGRAEEEGLPSDIVYSVGAGVMYSKARELLNNYLQNTRKDNLPDVIFCFNDAITGSVVSVLEEHGLQAGRDIYVCAFSPGSDTRKLLEEGRISWTYQLRSSMAEVTAQTAVALAAGETTPTEHVLEGEAVWADE